MKEVSADGESRKSPGLTIQRHNQTKLTMSTITFTNAVCKSMDKTSVMYSDRN